MHGISRIRLPMSAKLPAICAIRSANGFGMKCVHASMRIMVGVLWPRCAGAARGRIGGRSGRARRARDRARAMAGRSLSSGGLPRGPQSASALGVEGVAQPDQLRIELFQLVGAASAHAEDALLDLVFLLPH